MRVTRLEADARSGGVRVQVDSRPFGTIGVADVAFLSLAEDRELDQAKMDELTRRAEAFSARSVALRLLGGRSLPGAELTRRLLRRGHSKPAVEIAVQGLRDSGLVDDANFARHFVRTRAHQQKFGPRRLLGDLRRLGVSERMAEQALADVTEADGIDPKTSLREAAEKKARTLGSLAPDVAQRRLRAFLLRRGFGGGEVAAVVRELTRRN